MGRETRGFGGGTGVHGTHQGLHPSVGAPPGASWSRPGIVSVPLGSREGRDAIVDVSLQGTYESDQVIRPEQDKRDGGELERDAPWSVWIIVLQLPLERNTEDGGEVASADEAEAQKDLLVDESPWRVAGSEEYGLRRVSIVSRIQGPDSYMAIRLTCMSRPWEQRRVFRHG